MNIHENARFSLARRIEMGQEMTFQGLSADYLPVDLRVNEHTGPAFKAINPQAPV